MATAAQTNENPNLPAGTENEPELSLRETLEAEFEREPTDEVSTREQSEREAPSDDGRVRDQFGRFKPKLVEPAEKPATQPQETTQERVQGVAPITAAPKPGDAAELKAPASWTPQAREEWAALPPRIKAEVHRREYEAQQVVQQGAQQRQFVQAFENVMRPYEVFIRAENSNPLQAVQNMMQTAAELRVGTPGQKANLVAGIIRQFAVDLPMLDTLLANNLGGAPMQAQQQPPQQFRDPRFDAYLAEQQRRDDADMARNLSAFAEKHEFYGDVAATMAELVEIRSKQGQAIDLEKIYEQACKLDEGVSTILASRVAAQKTNGSNAAVLRAKRAASSVRSESTPEGATVPRDDSVRASLEAAFENAGRA